MQAFAAGDIDDIGVGSRHGNGANRLRWLVIKDRIPGTAVVVGLPDSAIDRADVKDARLHGNACRSACATAAKWADHAPLEFLIGLGGNLRRRRSGERQERETTRKITKYWRCFHV